MPSPLSFVVSVVVVAVVTAGGWGAVALIREMRRQGRAWAGLMAEGRECREQRGCVGCVWPKCDGVRTARPCREASSVGNGVARS